jgi:hypothetical protein
MDKYAQMLIVAERAIELDIFDRRRLNDLQAYREAVRAWQSANRKYEHLPSDSDDWKAAQKATAGEYGVLRESKRHVANARKRLSTAIRKYRESTKPESATAAERV